MTQHKDTAREANRTAFDRLGIVGFALGVAALVFLGGLLVAIADLPPARLVRDAAIAARTLLDRQGMIGQTYPEWLWSPAIHPGSGLVRHDASSAYDGYTLYASGHGGVAILLDMQGNEVHHWDASFSSVWPNTGHVGGGVPDNVIHIRRAHVYPNGDLLVVYETPADTPFGYGLAKIDRDGRPKWTYDANAHHDFDIADDGTIFVLTQEIRTEPVAGWPSLRPPVLEEFIAVLSPDGRELQRLSLFDALVGTPYFRPKTFGVTGDIIHSNTVHVVGEAFASHYEPVSAGDLMVCLRHLDLIAIVGRDSGKIVWAMTGPWQLPHDPDPLESGRIMIFDNIYAGGAVAGSRVIEFDPVDETVRWAYAGSADEPFRSDIRATSEILPNGNLLIAESDYGRIFEVTREGRIVWEFVNPVRGGERDELIPVVCGVRRYSADELPFLSSRTVASQ